MSISNSTSVYLITTTFHDNQAETQISQRNFSNSSKIQANNSSSFQSAEALQETPRRASTCTFTPLPPNLHHQYARKYSAPNILQVPQQEEMARRNSITKILVSEQQQQSKNNDDQSTFRIISHQQQEEQPHKQKIVIRQHV